MSGLLVFLKKAMPSMGQPHSVQRPGTRGGKGYYNNKGQWVYGERPMARQPKQQEPDAAPRAPKAPEPPQTPEQLKVSGSQQRKQNKTALETQHKQQGTAEKMSAAMQTRREIRQFLVEFKPALEETFTALNEIAGEHGIVMGRLKGEKSLVGKLKRYKSQAQRDGKASKGLSDIQDVAGTRIVFDNMDAVRNGIREMRRRYEGRVLEESNYLDKPKDGYRSYHFIVLSSDNHPVEVQLRTMGQNYWADWSHDQLYSAKISQEVPKNVRVYSHQVSEALWRHENHGRELKLPPCPPDAARLRLCFKWDVAAH